MPNTRDGGLNVVHTAVGRRFCRHLGWIGSFGLFGEADGLGLVVVGAELGDHVLLGQRSRVGPARFQRRPTNSGSRPSLTTSTSWAGAAKRRCSDPTISFLIFIFYEEVRFIALGGLGGRFGYRGGVSQKWSRGSKFILNSPFVFLTEAE